MKKILMASIISLTFSCNTERNKETETDHESYDEKEMVEGEPWNNDSIESFMHKAAQVDLLQIELGKLAKKRAANESVGIYGDLLVKDHTYSLQNLNQVADQRQVTLLDSLYNNSKVKINKFETLEGQAFDRQFLDMMIKDHKKDIQLYEKALQNIPDEHPMKQWVDNTLTSLRRHLQKGQQLKRGIHSPEE